MILILNILAYGSLNVLAYLHTDVMCSNNEHIVGKWLYKNPISPQNKSYYCCGYDRNDFLHSTDICGTIKTDLNEHFGSNTARVQFGGHSCECDKKKHGRAQVSIREQYRWYPNNCSLVAWNASLFCNLLDNRRIFFYGDSTMQQSALGLMSLIKEANESCAIQLFYWKQPLIFPNSRLIQKILHIRPDFIILNFGAHGTDSGDTHHIMQQLIAFVNTPLFKAYQYDKKVDYIKEDPLNIHDYNVTVLWRTNAAGHVGCDAIDKPFINYDLYVNHTYTTEATSMIDKYHWHEFPEWDRISKDYINNTDIQLIDMSPLYYRADAHPGNGDCLHFCVPGPTDLFSQLLLQKLFNHEV
eukprot:gene12933-17340_t